MTRPDGRRPRVRWWWLPLALIPVAVVLAVVATSGDDRSQDAASSSTAPDPSSDVAVLDSTSDADPADLVELASLSDLVVVGEVRGVERGRVFASSGAAADDELGQGIESALVTVEVDQVVHGEDPGPSILIEEEGWLADGRRISLDGAPPTEVGDVGLWFLIDTGDPDVPAWVTVGRFGRWVVRDGVLVGPQLDEPIAIDLQDRPLNAVLADIVAGGAGTTIP